MERNPATRQMEQHSEEIHFEDDLANSGFDKAKRYGDEWHARGPAEHSYEVYRDPS